MEYNLSSIRNQVLDDKLDDTSFDSAVVDRFINATQRDIFNTFQLPFQEKVFSGTLPAGNRIFAFPEDFQALQGAVITDPDDVQQDILSLYLPYKEFNMRFPTPANNVPGRISAWTSYAGKIYTSAPIDQAYKLDIFYLKKPTILTDDADVPEIPEEFQEALVLGTYKRVLERNEDFDLAATIGNQYNDQLDKMVSRYGFRIVGQPIVFKQPRRASRRSR